MGLFEMGLCPIPRPLRGGFKGETPAHPLRGSGAQGGSLSTR